MFWTILFIVFVIIYFYSTTKKDEINKVNRDGGIYIKYRILVDHFLDYPGVVIEKRSSTSIILTLKDSYAMTRFTISHGFEDVTIFWNHENLTLGSHSLNWTFPENYSQHQMIKIIEDKLEIYQKNLLGNGFR